MLDGSTSTMMVGDLLRSELSFNMLTLMRSKGDHLVNTSDVPVASSTRALCKDLEGRVFHGCGVEGEGFISSKVDLSHLEGGVLANCGVSSGKKRCMMLKSQGVGVALVVGENIGMDQILDLLGITLITLVHKFLDNSVGMDLLVSWMDEH